MADYTNFKPTAPITPGVSPMGQTISAPKSPNSGYYSTSTNSLLQSPATSGQTATPAPVAPVAPAKAPAAPNSGSIVDYLNGQGQASDYTTRSGLAAKYGIQGYAGTAEQNTQLLNMMRSGQQPAAQTATTQTATTPTTTGTTTTATTPATTETKPSLTPDEKAVADGQKARDAIYAEIDKTGTDAYNKIIGIQNGSVPLSEGQQAQIDGLKQQFQQMIEQQKSINVGAKGYANVTGYQTGAAEYDPVFQARTIGTIISTGLQKVADLNTKMATAVAQMTEGFRNDNIEQVKTAYDLFSKVKEKRAEELTKVIETAQTHIKDAQTRQDKITESIQDIQKDAAQNGATPETIANIGKAGTVGAAIAAAGDSLQKATGDAGEYLFYRNNARSQGLTPLSYDSWYAKKQQASANAKYAEAYASAKGKAAGEAAAGIGSGGVSGPYAGVINTILASGKFTAQQTNAIKNGIANGEDPMTVIRNNARDILGATEGGKVFNFQLSKDAMGDLKTSLDQYYAKGGETNLLKGKYEDAIAKLGNVKDPELRSIATQISAALQIYRNAVSGTAYSVQEGAQIASVFPGIDNTKGLNDAIIQGRMKAFDSVIDNAYRGVLGSSYDKLKAQDPIEEEKMAKTTIDSYVTKNPDKLGKIEPLINAGKTNAQIIDYMKLHPEVYGTI